MEKDYQIICFSCLGEGQLEREAFDDCPYCDGTGWIADDDYDEEESEGTE